jgi:hypothetical protein
MSIATKSILAVSWVVMARTGVIGDLLGIQEMT